MIFALILLVLLGVSFLFNVGRVLTDLVRVDGVGTRTAGPKLDEVLVEDHNASDKIAVVDIDGIISSSLGQGGFDMVEIIKAQLKRAKNDRSVKAVLLKVDSPGGEVLASDEIYRTLTDFQKQSGKPVICSMGSLAASGGYYVSAPCRWIVANDLTITGSIGVILHSWNYRGLMDKVGLRPEVYKSGRFKDMLSGEREPSDITPEERQMVQALIDETYGKFTNIVAVARERAHKENQNEGQPLVSDWTEYADGRVLSGTEAYKLGFVDQVGDFDDAVKQAKKIAGISQANLVRYQMRLDLSDLFRLFGQSDARALKVDWGVELPKLKVGQLYFLSPTYLH